MIDPDKVTVVCKDSGKEVDRFKIADCDILSRMESLAKRYKDLEIIYLYETDEESP